MLTRNTPAPIFNSIDQYNKPVSLRDFAGKTVLLYFYPKDDTPGCTIQANDFTAMANEFSQAGCVVIGVSKDDCDSHNAFIDKFGLNLILLADTSGEVCEQYGVWQQKEKNGVKSMGIVRSTFIIDGQGQLSYVEYTVDPKGHAQKMLEFIKSTH